MSARSRCFLPATRPRRSPAPPTRSMAAGSRSSRLVKNLLRKLRSPGKPKSNRNKSNRKKINLGLQGGGAHGAFTWGVLDALLEDERLDIEGISGTSAGAMNAVMLADGLARGGAEEARKRLAAFW